MYVGAWFGPFESHVISTLSGPRSSLRRSTFEWENVEQPLFLFLFLFWLSFTLLASWGTVVDVILLLEFLGHKLSACIYETKMPTPLNMSALANYFYFFLQASGG